MKEIERKRLNYKPDINIKKNISTQYSKDVRVEKKAIATVQPVIETPQVSITPVLQSYKANNIGKPLEKAVKTIKEIDKKLNEFKNRLTQNELFTGLPDAINNGDIISIDNYANMAENISGDIIAEVYPKLKTTRDDLQRLVETINEKGFNNTIDIDELDKFIEEQDALRDAIIRTEQSVTAGDETAKNNPINYKEISIDTQISKFVTDRVESLISLAVDLVTAEMKTTLDFALPKNTGIVEEYYELVKETYINEKDKMDSFRSSDMIHTLLDKVYELKAKVLNNRRLLAEADSEEFFAMLPIAKMIEDKFSQTTIDLFKAQITDEINKGDYINSLLLKNNIREHYKGELKDSQNL